MPSTELDTHEKALAINLDQTIFGSFAEIGAGQEVARWFLQVGAASGTVAKTVSAYDKEVSDDLYGAGTRYVSIQRLEAMLDREWNQLLTQLQKSRGPSTRFFIRKYRFSAQLRRYKRMPRLDRDTFSGQSQGRASRRYLARQLKGSL